MARRGGFGGGMPNNMNNLMKQAQKMQKQMAQMQEEMETTEFEATAGGGVVKAVVSGKKELKNVIIDPEAVDPEDVEMLQDLIVAAVNEALRQAEDTANQQMSKFTGGMNLPKGLI